MMRSMFTGVSGLKAHMTKMDVIANNISNVNTVAFKAGRVNFNEVLNQTIKKASAASDESQRGSTNPMQFGLGSVVASIDKLMEPGSGQRTDDPMDVMIDGSGFFIVADEKGQYFTRAGNFSVDLTGNLNINGYQVYGWDVAQDEETKVYEVQKTAVQPISFTGDKETMPGEPSTLVNFSGNLNGEDGAEGIESEMSVYDSEGNRYTVPILFKYDQENSTEEISAWSYEVRATGTRYMAYQDGDPDKPFPVNFSATQGDTASWHPLGWLGFDTSGKLVMHGTGENTLQPPTNVPEGRIQLTLFMNVPADNGNSHFANVPADNGEDSPKNTFGSDGSGAVVLDFTNLTQFGNENSNAMAESADGNPIGYLNDFSIGNDGQIIGTYTNDKTRLLGQISIADFQNPSGLLSRGDNLFVASVNSGEFDGIGHEGSLTAGMLEMSNVDLSTQFTQMITTQRGFQTNSRVITTSNEMLQTALGLKR